MSSIRRGDDRTPGLEGEAGSPVTVASLPPAAPALDFCGEVLAVCLVELRGFEPLTPCMPWTACPRERRCSEPSPLVKVGAQLSAGYRCCPLLSPTPCPRHAPRAPLAHESLEHRSKRRSA